MDKPARRPAPPQSANDVLQQNVLFVVGSAAVYAAMVYLYWPTLDYSPLSLDDQSQLGVVAGLSFSELWYRDHFGHFRPVKNLLFWLISQTDDISVWRGAALGLFASTTAAVQMLAAKVSESRWLGLGAALCWALHPSTASGVCWLSATNGMIALFAMLVYLLLSDLSAATLVSPLRRRAYRAAAVGALALGLLSHELVLLSPLLLFFLQRLRRPGKKEWRLYASATVVMVAYACAAVGVGGGAGTPYRFESESPRWLMAFSAARYFGENALLWFLPRGRFGVLLRDDPGAHLVASSAWWMGMLLAGISVWVLRHRDRTLTFALAWSAVSLATFSNFVPLGNTPVAVHYMLVPGVGLAVAVSRGFFLVAAQVTSARQTSRAVLLSATAVSLGGMWFRESRHVVAAWENDEQLYKATLENYPGNVEAMVNLSAFYLGHDRDADAAPLLEEARRLSPADLNVVRNSFTLLARAHQPQAVLDLLSEHPALMQRSEFLIREGEALQQLERFPQARAVFEKAFQQADPETEPSEWCAAGYDLAIAEMQTGAEPARVQTFVEQLGGSCASPELTRLRDLLR